MTLDRLIMQMVLSGHSKEILSSIAFIFLLNLYSSTVYAQFNDPDTSGTVTSPVVADPSLTVYENTAAGEFTPGKGFLMVKNDFASLNISLYASASASLYKTVCWADIPETSKCDITSINNQIA